MDIIKTYLENMFINLPKTTKVLKIKEELLLNMEEKYHELKKDGKTENEAIGIVISEFGNIDELVKEFGIEKEEINTLPELTQEDVEDYLTLTKRSGLENAIGVFLCITGAALVILLFQMIEDNIINIASSFEDVFGVVPLLVLVAIAVGLFIHSSLMLEKYKYIKEYQFYLTNNIKTIVKDKIDVYRPTHTIGQVVSITLIVLSPIIVIFTDGISESASTYGAAGLLFVIAIAVLILIYFSTYYESMTNLINNNYTNMTKTKRKSNKKSKVIQAISAIVWPITVIAFFITGFIFELWYINWLLFPIVGIIMGMLNNFFNIMNDKE